MSNDSDRNEHYDSPGSNPSVCASPNSEMETRCSFRRKKDSNLSNVVASMKNQVMSNDSDRNEHYDSPGSNPSVCASPNSEMETRCSFRRKKDSNLSNVVASMKNQVMSNDSDRNEHYDSPGSNPSVCASPNSEMETRCSFRRKKDSNLSNQSKLKHNITKKGSSKRHKKVLDTVKHTLWQHLNKPSNQIPKFPVIVMSSKLIHSQIHFDNVIILNNTKVCNNDSRKITYDTVPFYVGKEINYKRYRVCVSSIARKRIAIFSKIGDWENIDVCNSMVWKYELYDRHCKPIPTEYIHLDGRYVLIACISNEMDYHNQIKVNDGFLTSVMNTMKDNMNGDGVHHFKSSGTYHGFGVVAKYSMKGNSSFGAFAEKKSE